MSPDDFRRVRGIFDEALQIEPALRSAFLEERCAGVRDLASEVRKLLNAHESGSAFFDRAGVGMMQGVQVLGQQANSNPAPELQPGQVIGSYQVIGKLASGGMGEVYLAHDGRLGRRLALKFLRGSFNQDPQWVRRFQQEARAASALTHPNVATIYDVGEAEGARYLAMEFVEGQTLGAMLQGRPLASAEIVEIATQAADALDEAHRRGITHRDIKPGNIMLTPRGQVKVLDFGIAKFSAAESGLPALPGGSDPLHTATGLVIGTPRYMSPEQALGREVDHRSDLFSLGVVMYEMATGALPFTGATSSEAIDRLLHAQPSAIGRLNYEVPAELERIVRKCLEKERERRYQTAGELLVDLKNLKRDSVTGQAPTLQTASPPRGNRRRLILVAALGAAVALAAAGGVVYRGALGNRKPQTVAAMKSVAVLPLKSLGDQPKESEYLADGISEALITKLTRLPNVRVIPWVTAERYKGTTEAPQALARELRVDALITGSVRKSGERIAVTISLIDGESGMQSWADQFEERLADIFAVQARIALGAATQLKGKLTGPQEQALTQSAAQSAEAYEIYLRGKAALDPRDKYNLAMALFQKAVKLDPNLAEAYAGIGSVQYLRAYAGWEGNPGSMDEVEATYRHALSLNPTLAGAYNGLITVCWLKGKGEEGLEYGKKAATLGLEDADNLYARASAYYYGGLWDKAVSVCHRILEIDPANEAANSRIVASYLYAGKFHQAAEAGERYLRTFGDKPRVHFFTANAYHCLGDFERAEIHYRRAIELTPDDDLLYDNFGYLYQQNGRPEDARRIWAQQIDVVKRKLEASPRNPGMHLALSRSYGTLGDREGLLKEEQWFARELPENGWTTAALGVSFVKLGDMDRAVAHLRQGFRLGFLNFYWKNVQRAEGVEGLTRSAAGRAFLKEWTQTIQRLHEQY